MHPTLEFEFCARTDIGRVRGNNEDVVAFYPEARLAIVADGMGGYNAGEVASAMAVQILERTLCPWLVAGGGEVAEIRDALLTSVAHANSAILDVARSDPQYTGMGTTLIAGIFGRDRLVLGHVGDSRGYRLRAGELSRMTRDHTWLQEQVDSGLITSFEAEQSGLRSLLTRALGVDEQVQLEINEFMVEPGDLFLFCSDGLTDRLDDAALAVLLRDPSSLALRAERLVQQANTLGGRDNVSVLLARARAATGADGLPR